MNGLVVDDGGTSNLYGNRTARVSRLIDGSKVHFWVFLVDEIRTSRCTGPLKRQKLDLLQTIAFPSPTIAIITHIHLSEIIYTLDITLALRRIFKNRYQRRDTKANISSKGETVQHQIHIVTGKTFVATKNRPHQERKESTAGRAPSSKTSYRHSWNQEVLAILCYSTSTFQMGL
ncbi:hypothetical protein IW262DRAFT_1300489 [Armillaria fumosa]|nr:hypothetical protein IW262DRAFT_1300489 [Armillaria fumosa]